MISANKRIAVVGYGIAGRTVAYALTKRGYQVTAFVDAESPCTASYAAQGISAMKGLIFPRSNLFGLKMRGHEALFRLIHELQEQYKTTIIHPGEVLEPYSSQEEQNRIVRRIYGLQFMNLYNVANVDSRADLGPSVRGALQYPKDFIFSPSLLLQTLDDAARSYGLKVLSDKVLKLNVARRSVTTSKEALFFDHIVLAAGTGTEEVLKNSGYPSPKARYIAGTTLAFSSDKERYFGLVRGKHSLVWFGKQLRVGSTSWTLKNKNLEFENTDTSELNEILLLLEAEHREALDAAAMHHGVRVCLEGMSPTFKWLENNHGGVFLIYGLYKNGYQLAPLIAEFLIRDLSV